MARWTSRRIVRAVLLYHQRQHIIKLFTWPSAATDGNPKLREGMPPGVFPQFSDDLPSVYKLVE